MKPALRRALFVIGETILVLIGVVLLSGVGLYLSLPSKPFESRFGRQLAEMVLSDVFDGAPVKFERLLLQKGSITDPIHIEASAMQVYATKAPSDQELAKPVLTASDVRLDISIIDLLTGQDAISLLEVDNLVLVARRNLNGQFRFELASSTGSSAQNTPVDPLEVMDSVRTLKIDNAKLVFEDAALGTSAPMAFLNINIRRNSDFKQDLITITGEDATQKNKPVFDFVLTTTDTQDTAEIILYVHELPLERLVPWVPQFAKYIVDAQGGVSGEIRLLYNKDSGKTTDFRTSLTAAKGTVMLAQTAKKAIAFEDIVFSWTEEGGQLAGKLQNRSLLATADRVPGDHFDLNVKIPEVAAEDVAAFFPEDASGVAHEWLTTKLGEGLIKDISFTGRLQKSKKGEGWTMVNPKADFRTENMRVLYKLKMAPARQLDAIGKFENDTLVMDIKDGNVQGMNVVEGKLTFSELTKEGRGHCTGRLRLQGPLQSVLAYLDNPIIRYRERVSLDLSKADGHIAMTVVLDFPTTKAAKMADIKVNVDAVLRRASLPDIVPGVTLGGGPVAIKGNPDHVSIFGDATLNGAPASIKWDAYFNRKTAPFIQKLDLTTSITRETLEGFGVGGWGRDMKSPSKAVLHYRQPVKGAPSADLTLSGPDLSVRRADIVLSPKGQFVRGRFDGLVLGQTAGDISVSRNEAGGQNIAFSGPRFDARPALNGGEKKGKTKQPAHLSVDIKTPVLITSDNAAVHDVALAMNTNRRGDISRLNLTGTAGKGSVKVAFNEGPNGDTLNVDAGDAGKLLEAMALSDGVKGGVLQIQGRPNGNYGSMVGRARIMNFTAQDVPALGRLINALSLPGLFQLFSNQGIFFERLRADFTWTAKDSGSMLVLKDGRTAGASLGLTFKGAYNHGSKMLDLQGEVVPLSEINGIIKAIPLLGPLLSGGKNSSLVAAHYTMRGPAKDPDVSINPLSVLAPGLIRRILFEGGVEE